MYIVPIAYVVSNQHMLLLPCFQSIVPVMPLGIPFLSLPIHTSKREASI